MLSSPDEKIFVERNLGYRRDVDGIVTQQIGYDCTGSDRIGRTGNLVIYFHDCLLFLMPVFISSSKTWKPSST